MEYQEVETNLDLVSMLDRIDLSKRVLLVKPPVIDSSQISPSIIRKKGYFSYPPYGLLQLGAIFDEVGVKSDILDINNFQLKGILKGEDISTTLEDYLVSNLGEIGLICVNHMFDYAEKPLIDLLSKLQAISDVPIIIGGVAATANYKSLLEYEAVNCIALGEGVDVIEQIVTYKTTNKLPSNLVCAFDKEYDIDREIYKTQRIVEDIRSQYEKINLEDYSLVGTPSSFFKLRDDINVNYATILTKVGCRGRCSFCTVRYFNGKSVRVRTVESVVSEMKYLCDNKNVKHFELLDDDFLYNRSETIDLLNSVASNLPGISWSANNGLIIAALDEEIMRLMVDSGCLGFKVALESGSEKILRNYRKPISLKKYREGISMINTYSNIFVSTNIILGSPSESFFDMQKSFEEVNLNRSSWVNFYNYQNLPGTELFEESKKKENHSFNPSRESRNHNTEVLSGYDIFDIDSSFIPCSDQLREIWFTFNTITNYLNNPILYRLDDRVLVYKMVKWLNVLSDAYPDNPLILSLLAFLIENSDIQQNKYELIDKVETIIENDKYWERRNNEFSFLDFVYGKIPNKH